MVERYVPATGEAALLEQTQRLTAGAGREVRLLLTLYAPEEESCLHVFAAPSLTLVELASREAGVVFDRVASVVQIGNEGSQ